MGSYNFDGVDDKATIPHAADLALSDTYTIMSWTRYNDTGGALNDGRFVNKALSTASGPMQLIQNSSGLVRHRTSRTSGGDSYAQSTVTVTADTWNFNTGRIPSSEGATVSRRAEGRGGYGGAALHDFTTYSGAANTGAIASNSNPVYVGGNDTNNRMFRGHIAYVLIWNRELTTQEITDLYAGTLPTTGLVRFVDFTAATPVEHIVGATVTVSGATYDAGVSPPVTYTVGGSIPAGTATGTWTFTGTAAGATTRTGTAIGTHTWTGTAQGATTRTGTATGAATWTGTATGTTTRAGTATGAWTWTDTATGQTPTGGTATGTWTFTGTAAGTSTRTGAAAGAWDYTGTAAGATARTGTATGAWTWTGTAVGSSAAGDAAELLHTPAGALRPEWSFTAGTPATGTIDTTAGVTSVTIPDGSRKSVFATGDTDATAGITRPATGSIDYAVQVATDIKGDGGIGVNLLLSGAAGEDVLACLYSTTTNAQGYGFTRAGGSGGSYVLKVFALANSGHGAWIRLTYNAATGAVTFRHSVDGYNWTTHGAGTRTITPATFKIGLSSTSPFLGGTVRLTRVVDMTELGSEDARAPVDYTQGATILSSDFTAGIPAWVTSYTMGAGTVTATGGALRLSTGTTGTSQVSSAQVVANTGAATNVGVTCRTRWTSDGDGDQHYGVLALGVDEGGIDQYARGPAYVIEPNEGSTSVRFLRVSKPASNDTFEEPYTFLVDLPNGTLPSPTAAWTRYRLERFGARIRFRAWADGAAEPTTWLFDGDDPVYNGPIGPALTNSHSNAAVTTIPSQWDVDDVEFYGLTAGAAVPAGTATGAWAYTGIATGSSDRTGTAAGAVEWTGTAAGSTDRTGTAAGVVTWTGAAQGTTDRTGAAVGAWDYAGTATGSAPVVGGASGTATGAWSFTGTAAGANQRTGTASGAWAYTGAATGAAPTVDAATGSATGTWTITGTATGRKAPAGVATGTAAWTGTAAGTTTRAGTATGAWTFTGAAVGADPDQFRDITLTVTSIPDRWDTESIPARLVAAPLPAHYATEATVHDVHVGSQEYQRARVTETGGQDITGAALEAVVSTSVNVPDAGWAAPDVVDRPTVDVADLSVLYDAQSEGRRYLWVRVTDNPEVAARRVGAFTVLP